MLYLFILFVMLGCGAQNSPIEEPSSASSASSDSSVDSFATPESNMLLPESVAIDFPNALKSSSNSSFNQKVNRIQKVIDSEKYNLELLKLAIDEIEQACPESNTTCNFGKDEFRVNHNHQTILLGAINFSKYQEENRSSYDLLLHLNDDVRVRYEWKDDEKDVFTTYMEANNSLKLHYFRENNKREASYLNEYFVNEKNSFMINLENNGSSLYRLTSNHIKNNKEAFSTNLRVLDRVLIEDNRSFTISRESILAIRPTHETLLNLIEDKNLKDGDYLIFDGNSTVENLNLAQKLKASIGHFTYLKKEVFGLVLNESNSTEFTIIPLN